MLSLESSHLNLYEIKSEILKWRNVWWFSEVRFILDTIFMRYECYLIYTSSATHRKA